MNKYLNLILEDKKIIGRTIFLKNVYLKNICKYPTSISINLDKEDKYVHICTTSKAYTTEFKRSYVFKSNEFNEKLFYESILFPNFRSADEFFKIYYYKLKLKTDNSIKYRDLDPKIYDLVKKIKNNIMYGEKYNNSAYKILSFFDDYRIDIIKSHKNLNLITLKQRQLNYKSFLTIDAVKKFLEDHFL